MKTEALLLLNVRELALIYEEMYDVMNDESYHLSERKSAKEVYDKCAELLDREGRPPSQSREDAGSWNRYD